MRRPLSRLFSQGCSGAQLGALKLRAIDVACRQVGCRSVADLGGVWAVDGGYALYAIDRHGAQRAVICDDDFTDALVARAGRDPRVELVKGNFGTPEAVASIGRVDVILMFDVLLHQVDPDWDRVLAMYSEVADCIVLAGPWWKGAETVRLLDLGSDAYLELVPDREFHRGALDRLDEYNEARGRRWRDCHDIWQWGITDPDLRETMGRQGFKLAHQEHAGSWRGLEQFDDSSYVFVRN